MNDALAGILSIAAQALALTGLFLPAHGARRFSRFFFILAPILIAVVGLSLGNQTGFGWIKLVSVCVACVWINLLRTTVMGKKGPFLYVIVAIFIGNILEASIQNLFALTPVTALNSVLGLVLILTIDFRQRPYIETEKPFSLLWHGVGRLWILSYSLWNLAFIYVHFPLAFFYHMAVLSVFLAAEFLKPGLWGEARAYTLAVWMMILFAFSEWMDRYAFVIAIDGPILVLLNIVAVALLLPRALQRLRAGSRRE